MCGSPTGRRRLLRRRLLRFGRIESIPRTVSLPSVGPSSMSRRVRLKRNLTSSLTTSKILLDFHRWLIYSISTMNIKEYLDKLEQTKQSLLSLNLPDNTPIVDTPDMGCLTPISKTSIKFEVKDVYKYNSCYNLYSHVCDKELTEKQMVVILSEHYTRN